MRLAPPSAAGAPRRTSWAKGAACGCGCLHLSLDLVGVRSEHVLDPGLLVLRQIESSRHPAEEALREISVSLPPVKGAGGQSAGEQARRRDDGDPGNDQDRL